MAGFGVAPFYVRRELFDRIHPANALLDVQARLYAISRSKLLGPLHFRFSLSPTGEVE